eukprot:6113167-Prymnesium_polylepis.1
MCTIVSETYATCGGASVVRASKAHQMPSRVRAITRRSVPVAAALAAASAAPVSQSRCQQVACEAVASA